MKPMTEVQVLRSVPVYDDGVTPRQIIAGTIDRVPSELLLGLEAEGYVKGPAGQSAQRDAEHASAAIPSGWRDLHHLKIIALAKAIDPSVTKKDEAVTVLELAEKAAAEAQQV